MKILILSDYIPPEHNGGAEKLAWSHAKGLYAAGHEVHVITSTQKSYFSELRDGISTYHLHVNYPNRLCYWFALYNPQVNMQLQRLYAKIKPDIVHAQNVHNALTYHSLNIAHNMGIPVVFTALDTMTVSYGKLTHFVNPQHCGVSSPTQYRLPLLYNLRSAQFRYNPFRNLVIHSILSNAVRLRIAISNALKEGLEANGLPAFRTIYSGFEAQNATNTIEFGAMLRQRFGIENRRVILIAGRFSKEKGFFRAFAALDHLVKRVPDVVLLVLTGKRFELPAEYQHLKSHICQGGWLNGDELIAAYQLADVVTVPSIYLDAIPMINIEGMAMGKPLVSTCYGGSPEFVEDGKTGYIVNPFNTEMYAERLAHLLNNPELAQQMGKAGYQRYLDKFTLTTHIENVVNLYREILK